MKGKFPHHCLNETLVFKSSLFCCRRRRKRRRTVWRRRQIVSSLCSREVGRTIPRWWSSQRRPQPPLSTLALSSSRSLPSAAQTQTESLLHFRLENRLLQNNVQILNLLKLMILFFYVFFSKIIFSLLCIARNTKRSGLISLTCECKCVHLTVIYAELFNL